MRYFLLFILFSFLLVSCSKNAFYEPRELRIYKVPVGTNFDIPEIPDIMATKDINAIPGIVVYPNPTSGIFFIYTYGTGPFTINISNDKGDFKEFTLNQENNAFTIEEEKNGVYCLEILINNTVFKTSLIKR